MNWYLKVLYQYADFKGRARRQEYWMFVLINIINTLILIVLDDTLGTTYGEQNIDGYFRTFYTFAVLIPNIAVTARRMHDVGKSGWYLLIPIYSFILACQDSEHGKNKWGENPKEMGNNQDINQIGKE